MTVTALGNGRYEVATDSKRAIAYAVRQRDETWVFIGGQVFVVGAAPAASSRRSSQREDAALSPPMPATVVSINVIPGQAVKAGDLLVALEAMKMELAVTAPHDGTVRAVHCRPGELVQPGVALIDLVAPKPSGEGG